MKIQPDFKKYPESNCNNHAINRRYRKAGYYLIMFIMLYGFLFLSNSFGNGLSVSNLTYDQSAGTVTFDLSWNNSFRSSTTTAQNWDAAWVFVKFKDCSSDNTVQFTHGLVSTTLSDHTFTGTTIFEPTMKDGTLGIDASPNNTGVMLRNSANPATGTVTGSVILKLNNLPSTGSLDVRVFGIEMVFVPQNPFILGDGDGVSISTSSFAVSTGSLYASSIQNESAKTVFDASTSYPLTSSFPKGYGAFYIMKYEISQGQYVDFLNTSFSVCQGIHYPNSTGNRHTIKNTGTPPLPFTSFVSSVSKDDRACSFLAWADVATYLDWAALRPLTELEYEKACRGTLPAVPGEKAWGTITGTIPAVTGISGAENGTESISTANANINSNSIVWTSGDAGSITGPLRCGIFAKSTTTTRLQTGMGFYGAMELSGNVIEYYLSATSGTSSGSSATGVDLGNGQLDAATGNMDVSNWPSALTPASNIIRRGGSWATASGASSGTTRQTNVSIRNGGSTPTRDNTSGGRGGR